MSTILKALQKVEDSLKQQGEPTEVPDSFWGQSVEDLPDKPRRRAMWVGIGLLFLLCGTGGAGYWLYFGSRSGNQKSQVVAGRENTADTQPSEQINVQPVAPPGKPALASGVEKQVVEEGRVPVEKRAPVQSASPVAKREKVGNHSPAAVQTRPPLPRVFAVPPRIVVTGIAYQQDRTVRFAIVNDRALGEGETVQGAVVKEILEDRVRFVKNGSTFEVPLSR